MILAGGRLVARVPSVLPPAEIAGVFSTVGCDGGRPLLWPSHARRLSASLEDHGWDAVSLLPGRQQLEELLECEDLTGPAVLRVVIGFEPLSAGEGSGPWVEVSANVAEQVGPGRRPLRLAVDRWVRPPDPANKVLARRRWNDALTAARADGFDDVLLLDGEGRVLETAIANVFALFGSTAVTPPAPQRCLPGIMRGWLKAHLPGTGCSVEERDIFVEELVEADEVWTTNSVAGVAPVAFVAGRRWDAWPVRDRLRSLRVPAPGWGS